MQSTWAFLCSLCDPNIPHEESQIYSQHEINQSRRLKNRQKNPVQPPSEPTKSESEDTQPQHPLSPPPQQQKTTEITTNNNKNKNNADDNNRQEFIQHFEKKYNEEEEEEEDSDEEASDLTPFHYEDFTIPQPSSLPLLKYLALQPSLGLNASDEEEEDDYYKVVFKRRPFGLELITSPVHGERDCYVVYCTTQFAHEYVRPWSRVVSVNKEKCVGRKFEDIKALLVEARLPAEVSFGVRKCVKVDRHWEKMGAGQGELIFRIGKCRMVKHPAWNCSVTWKQSRVWTSKKKLGKEVCWDEEIALIGYSPGKEEKALVEVHGKDKIIGKHEVTLPREFGVCETHCGKLVNSKGKNRGELEFEVFCQKFDSV